MPREAAAAARRALLLVAVIGALATLVGAAVGGADHAWGLGIGTAVVLAANALTLAAVQLTRTRPPQALAGAVLVATFTKIVAVFVVMVSLRSVAAVSTRSLGLAIVVGVVLGGVLDAVLITRAQVPIVDDPPPGSGPGAAGTVPSR